MLTYEVWLSVEDLGRCRFEEWYYSLRDKRARLAVQRCVTKLQAGNFGDVKHLGERLFELRVHFGPGYRIYFTKQSAKIVLLLSGGDKGTQAKDILKARKLVRTLKTKSYEKKKSNRDIF